MHNTMTQEETGIHQKRTLAFINHFIMRTIEFMNNFATQCESKLMEFENKLQKTEAALIILETKLSSIPELQELDSKEPIKVTISNEEPEKPADNPEPPDIPPSDPVDETVEEKKTERDPQYEKFFKMIQFGVPVQAVKLKVSLEGLDPNVIG